MRDSEKAHGYTEERMNRSSRTEYLSVWGQLFLRMRVVDSGCGRKEEEGRVGALERQPWWLRGDERAWNCTGGWTSVVLGTLTGALGQIIKYMDFFPIKSYHSWMCSPFSLEIRVANGCVFPSRGYSQKSWCRTSVVRILVRWHLPPALPMGLLHRCRFSKCRTIIFGNSLSVSGTINYPFKGVKSLTCRMKHLAFKSSGGLDCRHGRADICNWTWRK